MALGAALGAAGLIGQLAIGCGGGTSASPTGSGTSEIADAATRADAGSDSSPNGSLGGGSGADAMPDVGADAAVGFAVAVNEATALCRGFLKCCPDAQGAGSYDLHRCIDSNTAVGWEGTLPSDTRVYSRGHVVVDQRKATSCISALDSFPCGMQTPTQWGAITSACELVVYGTIPANSSGCISSFECAPGNYCDPTVDGGLCTPLAKQGQPCNTKISASSPGQNPIADEMCSYLSSGQPPLFCDLINNAPDAATCQPLLANGAGCSNAVTSYFDDQACAPPALCGDSLQCGGTASYPYTNFCQFFRIADAGSD